MCIVVGPPSEPLPAGCTVGVFMGDEPGERLWVDMPDGSFRTYVREVYPNDKGDIIDWGKLYPDVLAFQKP